MLYGFEIHQRSASIEACHEHFLSLISDNLKFHCSKDEGIIS